MKYNNNFLTEYFNRIQRYDIDLINTIEYCVKEEEEYFGDEDEEYDEDLLEKYNLYDIECKDTNYEIIFSEDNMTIEEIENVLGPNLTQKIANREGYTKDNESYYLTDLLSSISVDDNNVDEVNTLAKRIFKTCGDYYKDCRGYILTDGTILDFGPNTDHVSITNVGNQRIASFLQLGNIRIGVQSIELACEPTFEQKRQLRRMINCYSDDELYVDIVQDKGYQYGQPLTSAKYINPSFDKVYGEISRFFDEGIKLNGGYCSDDLCENIIKLTESDLHRMIKESVNILLNELSHGIYQDASELAFDNEDDRLFKFRKAAEEAFTNNNEYISIGRRENFNNDNFINTNKSKKLIIFDNDYKDINDLYQGVKNGKLLIHCRGMGGEISDDLRYIYPCFSETLLQFYGGEYEEIYNSKKEYYGDDFDGDMYPELIFASDDFSWSNSKRNGIFFIESDGFQKSLGDGKIQLPNGRICKYYEGDVYDDDNELFREEPGCCEYGDWYSNNTAKVVAIMDFNS